MRMFRTAHRMSARHLFGACAVMVRGWPPDGGARIRSEADVCGGPEMATTTHRYGHVLCEGTAEGAAHPDRAVEALLFFRPR